MSRVHLAIISFLGMSAGLINAQPIPVELMLGNKYGAVNLVFSKNFSEQSRLGVFHINTVQFDYDEEQKNSFILQDLLFVETVKNLSVTGGVAYTKGGFSPTAGLQYVFSGRKLMILCSPRVNIENDPSYNVFSIIQYKPDLSENLKLFTRVQMLNVFDAGGNIKSYQWFRLGLEARGIQFGLALNLDELGPDPEVESSLGLFVRKEIF